MKRRATKLVLFVLLGAIINVAVASILWKRGHGLSPREAGLPSSDERGWLAQHVFIDEGAYVDSVFRVERVSDTGFERAVYFRPLTFEEPDLLGAWNDLGAPITPAFKRAHMIWEPVRCAKRTWLGWPTKAVVIEWVQPHVKVEDPYTVIRQGISLDPASPRYGEKLIEQMLNPQLSAANSTPIRLPWPGFAINTIFYAAILSGGWLPFAALLGAFRRRRRIKRGLCPKCGYDLRGSQNKLCPECGVSASKRS